VRLHTASDAEETQSHYLDHRHNSSSNMSWSDRVGKRESGVQSARDSFRPRSLPLPDRFKRVSEFIHSL